MRRGAEDCGTAVSRVVGRSVEGWVVVVFEGCLHDDKCQWKIIKKMRLKINKMSD